MKQRLDNQGGFTLVEIMMVVIIIGILAVLGIPRYQKYLLESKLSEVQVNIGEIKQGEAKYYNAHKQVYKAVEGNANIERYLRIELGSKKHFDYDVGTYGTDVKTEKGYVIRADLTASGEDELNAPAGTELWFVYPPENKPTGEAWEKGWYDDEFFGGSDLGKTSLNSKVGTISWSST